MLKKILPIIIFTMVTATFAKWPTNPTVNVAISQASLEQSYPSITPDGSGGAIIVWRDGRNISSSNYDIYAQRVDAQGTTRWAKDGIVICNAGGVQTNPIAISDLQGGAYFIWLDSRNSSEYDTAIYAQHVDSNGIALWKSNGRSVCRRDTLSHIGSPVAAELCAVPDGSGGVFVAWEDARSCYGDSIISKIINHRLVKDTVCAVQISSNSVPRIVLQHLVDTGATWIGNGVLSCDTAHTYIQYTPQLAADGVGGVYCIWTETHNSSTQIIYQHLASDGSLQLNISGVAVCTASGIKNNMVAAPDNKGGFVAAWEDNRNYLNSGIDIYAQRVNSSGSLVWDVLGDSVCSAGSDQVLPQIAADPQGNTYVIWQDKRNANNTGIDLYGQYLRAIDGSLAWKGGGVTITAATQDQTNQQILSDDSGGVYVAWVDTRSGSGDIYAKRMNSDGTTNWGDANGSPVCTATGNQDQLSITMSLYGNILCAWHDERNTNDAGGDIFAQQFTPSGALPIELANFTATPDNATGHVQLAWTTVSEINTVGFELFRKEGNETAYTSLGSYATLPTLAAHGTASGTFEYSFNDMPAQAGNIYYKLTSIDNDGSRQEFGPIEVTLGAPQQFTLTQNYPNPFSGTSAFTYTLPRTADVMITLSDMLGNTVRQITRTGTQAGIHTETIDAQGLQPGMYIVRLQAGMYSAQEKITIVK